MRAALAVRERGQTRVPDRLYMTVPGISAHEARLMADDAVAICRRIMPKASGYSARRLESVYGEGWFGIHWLDGHVWIQNVGARAFTMKNLAGKTIPMWIDDPTGKERQKNPKAPRRTTESGKVQILIFRRAAKPGQRRPDGKPASWPGAPGRISQREVGHPWTRTGRVGGQIAPGNIGVRWRFPGLIGRGFLHEALARAAYEHGHEIGPIHTTTGVR